MNTVKDCLDGVNSKSFLCCCYKCLKIFQFDCTNTLNDQLLEDVEVTVEGDGWEVLSSIKCPSLPYGTPGSCYTLLAIPEDIMATTGN